MNKIPLWIGIAMVISWAFLWLSVKIAAVGVHLLLLAGIGFVIWGLLQAGRSGP